MILANPSIGHWPREYTKSTFFHLMIGLFLMITSLYKVVNNFRKFKALRHERVHGNAIKAEHIPVMEALKANRDV